MRILIGLSGVARSGKDTAGRLLAAHHGFHVSGFADPMRTQAAAIDPVVGYEGGALVHYTQALTRYGYDGAKVRFPELRRFLQRLGTEGGRDIYGPDWWIERWRADNGVRSVRGVWSFEQPLMAITDVRFANEASQIRAMSGHIVAIHRDGVTAANGHVSETELGSIRADFHVDNPATLAELHRELDRMIDQIIELREQTWEWMRGLIAGNGSVGVGPGAAGRDDGRLRDQ